MVDELDESLDGPDDRRRYDRARLIVDMFFDGNDATGVASTKDISVGGFYMNTQANLPEGAILLCRERNVSMRESLQVAQNSLCSTRYRKIHQCPYRNSWTGRLSSIVSFWQDCATILTPALRRLRFR